MLRGRPVADRPRDVLIPLLCGYLAVVAVAPVATTPYRSDDITNQRQPELFAASGETVWPYIADWVGPWITDQGRFFPGSALWTFAVFMTFQDRFAYKLFVAGLVLLMVALVTATVVTLSTPALAPVAVAALVATLHLRDYFDGLDTFSGILPFTIGATFTCVLLLVRRRAWPSAIFAALLWTYVLLTYEVAIVLTPTLCVLVWWVTRRLIRTLPLVVPAVLVGLVVVVLRSRVTTFRGNAYRINLEPDRVLATYLKQAAGALPGSAQWFPGTTAGMTYDLALVVLALLLVGVPVAVLLTLAAGRALTVHPRELGMLALLGASMWLIPPVLVAVSLGWQNELPRGQAYVSVVWGYVGVAVLLTAGWAALAREGPGRGVRRVGTHAATAVVALCATAAVAQSITVAALLAVNPH